MPFRPILNATDAAQLHGLCLAEAIPLSLREPLMDFLSRVVVSDKEGDSLDRVAMGDQVTLASLDDSWPGMLISIVLPEHRDVQTGRLSIFSDISLAVLGSRVGDEVVWPEPPMLREMVVVSIEKADPCL